MLHVSLRKIAGGLFVCVASFLFVAGGIAVANDDYGADRDEAATIRRAVARGELVPLPRILGLARRHVPGDVIKVELEQEQGILIYEIKILTGNGRVREVKLNARTARLIAVEDD